VFEAEDFTMMQFEKVEKLQSQAVTLQHMETAEHKL
jgi:hypothetical protein